MFVLAFGSLQIRGAVASKKNPVDIAATGGTNCKKYLPPRFSKR